jgi:hypothetical protein
MPRLRFQQEQGIEREKASLYLPARPLPIPRTLVTPDSYRPPSVTPGPVPVAPRQPKPVTPYDGLPPDIAQMVRALNMIIRGKPLVTREEAFPSWRVDQINLVAATATWLDERNPQVGAGRFLQGRRAIIIVNHDAANAIRIRHADAAVGAQGGQIAAGGSISLPLASAAKIWGQAVAAGGSTISFYQFA